MLETPFGIIEIKIDGISIDYDYRKIPKDKTCEELDGRYAVKISYIPDCRAHTISCCIKDYTPSNQDFIEPGERLELNSFCMLSYKLSIGVEGEACDFCGEQKYSEFDYNAEYLTTGMQYNIFPETKTKN